MNFLSPRHTRKYPRIGKQAITWAIAASCTIMVGGTLLAQAPPLRTPEVSQSASVSQTIGLTNLEISYHRPGVNKRKVWGELVPYNQVWRAGANENTTFTTSDPITINGRALAAGTYGIHMLPTERDWTVIFNKVSSAWGSFAYDEKDDALRISVTPQAAPFQERLSYSFDDPTENAVTVTLRWDTLRVPFTVNVDVPSVVLRHMREDLKGLAQFSWQPWNQAANYSLRNGGDLKEAQAWVDRSISMSRTFANLRTKAAILDKQGDAASAASMRSEAMKLATEADINAYGYTLMNQNKTDEALAMFKKNVADYPKSWNAQDSLAEAYAQSGDKARAIESYTNALALTSDPNQQKRISDAVARLKK